MSALMPVLERLLARPGEPPVRVTSLRCEPSAFATLSPAYVLHMTLAGGARVAVFTKCLGAEQADHPEKKRRDREIQVYDQLLGDAGLPVARYYGSQRNELTGRHEVFLEYIDGLNLKYQELQHWFTAARRLGELHAHFARQRTRLAASDFLLQLDATYFREWPIRAVAATAELPALAARIRPLVEQYDRVTEILTRYPVTLVHNDLAPKNVIAVSSVEPTRICLVDWEMAGIGCGVIDLVDLKYGLDAENSARMRDSYCLAVAGGDLLPSTDAEVERLFTAGELHRTIYRISFWKTWGVPLERVCQWVGDAEQLMGQL